jgi:hypothetical protein
MADIALIIQGNLFSRDFLTEGIRRTPEWLAHDDASIDQLHADLSIIFSKLPRNKATSESQTEDDLIWPILSRIGWVDSLRQQNLAVKGRDDVPDGLLFANAEAKALANKFGETWKRYEHGLALVDGSIGLPPYNGGLFDETRTPLLTAIRLGDTVIADVIDALSFDHSSGERKYINYRDLSVRQLGSIYERLLEHEVRREDGVLEIRPNIFARKGSGSYYTPDDLVVLIIRQTVEPLITEKMATFREKNEELAAGRDSVGVRRATLGSLCVARAVSGLAERSKSWKTR